MMEFFKGWRRKVGVVTLLIACVLAGGWVRSLVVKDAWYFRKFEPTGKFAGVENSGGYLSLMKIDLIPTRHVRNPGLPDEKAFIAMRIGPTPIVSMVYISIVIPLTLLSAYLLLSKPRPPRKTVLKTLVPH